MEGIAFLPVLLASARCGLLSLGFQASLRLLYTVDRGSCSESVEPILLIESSLKVASNARGSKRRSPEMTHGLV